MQGERSYGPSQLSFRKP